ncbi:MAG: YeiH family protein [Myxococcales bacterium]
MSERIGSGDMRRGVMTALIVAAGLASLLPSVPSALALTAGIAIAVFFGNPIADRTKTLSRKLLPLAVIGLGGTMDLPAVLRVGARGIGYTIVGISVTFALGFLLMRVLKVTRRTGLLIAAGTAICGGSAIAAAAPVLGAQDEEISVALGTVFVLNSVALLVFPVVGHYFSLDQHSFGLWAALGIHDTSSVVGASLQYGREALEIATTVKLARALWIVPLTIYLARASRRAATPGAARTAQRPWFILGFLAVAALASFVPQLHGAGELVAAGSRRALVLTLFLIGLGLSRKTLKAVGLRPLVLGVVLWLTMACGTLAAIRTGLIAV